MSLEILRNFHLLISENRINTPETTKYTTRIMEHIPRNLQTSKFKLDWVLESIIRSHRGPQKYSYVTIALLSHVILVNNPDLSQKETN